jgi:hypothetical protein
MFKTLAAIVYGKRFLIFCGAYRHAVRCRAFDFVKVADWLRRPPPGTMPCTAHGPTAGDFASRAGWRAPGNAAPPKVMHVAGLVFEVKAVVTESFQGV